MTVRKAEFVWASIAGADAEPVEIIEESGRKGILTTGCADPFWLDDETAGVVIYANWLARPDRLTTLEEQAKADALYKARQESHGWRGPR